MSKAIKRIDVIGNIASGRSTLTQNLDNAGYNAHYESFEMNPFLKSFYKNPVKYAFETEISFLLQHYFDYKVNMTEGINVCDYSFILDTAFSKVTLTESEYAAFETLKLEILQKIGLPDLVIYTKCSPETSLRRIKLRGREMEQGIEIDYLRQLDFAISEEAKSLENIFVIDTDIVDLLDGKSSDYILRKVSDKLI